MTTYASFPELSGAMPTLRPDQVEHLGSFGVPLDVAAGETLFSAGEPTTALYLLDTASAEVVRPATLTAPQLRIVAYGPGHFVGEFTLFTGQNQYLTARVTEGGKVHRVDLDGFRRVMAEDPALSDVLLRALLTRRERLRDSARQGRAADRRDRAVGGGAGAADVRAPGRCCRTAGWRPAARRPRRLLAAAGMSAADLPVVVLLDGAIARATPGLLSEHVGLSRSPHDTHRRGPRDRGRRSGRPGRGRVRRLRGPARRRWSTARPSAGRPPAAPGSRTSWASRSGCPGPTWPERAQTQALKFGARIYTPCGSTRSTRRAGYGVRLSDGDDDRAPGRC